MCNNSLPLTNNQKIMLQILLCENECLKVRLDHELNDSVIDWIVNRAALISSTSRVNNLLIQVKYGIKIDTQYLSILLTSFNELSKLSVEKMTRKSW